MGTLFTRIGDDVSLRRTIFHKRFTLRTPVTFDEVISMRRIIEQKFHSLDPDTRYCVEKLAKSTERVITARDLLFQENEELIKQNNANSTRTSIVVGKAKVMSYEDIEKEIQRREEKEAARGSRRGRKGKKAGRRLVKGKSRARRRSNQQIANLSVKNGEFMVLSFDLALTLFALICAFS